jgi:hypothetical protein
VPGTGRSTTLRHARFETAGDTEFPRCEGKEMRPVGRIVVGHGIAM